MKVFFNALIVHLVLNTYVFVKGWKVLPDKKTYKAPYAILFILEFIIYLFGFIFNTKLPQEILKPILLIGTSWMVLIGYMAALLLALDCIKWISRWIPFLRKLSINNLRKKRIAFISTFIIVSCAMIYGSYRFWHPTVNELDINLKKNGTLDSLRVAVVSDIHVGYMIDKKVLDMYVDKIMEQKPDLILMVGDIIDYDLPPLVDQRMDEEFRKLKAPYGVYASTGNHEYRLNAEEKIAWLSDKAGINLLRDKSTLIANSLHLIGREDNRAPNRLQLKQITKDLDRNIPTIVMNHEPYSLYEESDENIDIALYGHTHNGQLFPYNIFINMVYEVGHGYKKKENTHVYVTSGLGLAGPQYRIGTISEILILNLKFNK